MRWKGRMAVRAESSDKVMPRALPDIARADKFQL
jgi:hypothetical protein